MENYIIGYAIGCVQTCVGYPLDTIKTRLQTGKSSNLFKGLPYAMASNMVSNTFLFGNYADTKSYIYMGAISGLLITPFETAKVNAQCGIKNYTGWSGYGHTILRETIAVPIYFGTYDFLKDRCNPWISGGLAGVLSCIVTYPIDTLKTRRQIGDKSTNNLFRGIGFSVVRAFIVNGISFWMYETFVSKNI